VHWKKPNLKQTSSAATTRIVCNETIAAANLRLWHTWCGCGTPGAVVARLVRLWHAWCGCGTPGASVIEVERIEPEMIKTRTK